MTHPTNEAAERTMDRRDAAIGYALLETEHLPGFARRGPAFREKLAQAGYRIEREAAEAAPSPDLIDRVERLLSFYERFVPHAVQSEYREVREDVIDAIAAVRLAAPSLLQERDQRAEGDVAAYTAWRRDPKRITADQLLQERDRLADTAIAALIRVADHRFVDGQPCRVGTDDGCTCGYYDALTALEQWQTALAAISTATEVPT